MAAYYFKPRVGKHYEEGLDGRRTLVLGVHQVCLYPDCPAYGRCTSPDGIRQMDVCLHQPDYELREANSLEMDSFLDPMPQDGFKYPTHSYFTRYMLQAEDSIDEQQKKDFWEHVAFFNFFQHYRQHLTPKPYRGNEREYQAEIPALMALLEELKPQVIYAWTKPLHDALANSKELRAAGLHEADIIRKFYGMHLSKFTFQTASEIPTAEDIRTYLAERLEGELDIANQKRPKDHLTLEEALFNCLTARLITFSNGELTFPPNKNNPRHKNRYDAAIYEQLNKAYELPEKLINRILVKHSPRGNGGHVSLRKIEPAEKPIREKVKRLFEK